MGMNGKLSDGNPDGRKSFWRRTRLSSWAGAIVAAAALVLAFSAILATAAGAHPSAMLRVLTSHPRHHATSTRSLATLTGTALPSSVQLYQWETSPSGGWITGNLGDHNSAYHEGDTVPFRLDVSGLAADTYLLPICRDFVNSSIYGYLTLKPFNTTLATGDSAPNTLG